MTDTEITQRYLAMLKTAFGSDILALLDDEDVIDVDDVIVVHVTRTGDFKLTDPGLPHDIAIEGGRIFSDHPEGGIIKWIHGDVEVVAPSSFRTSIADRDLYRTSHAACGITASPCRRLDRSVFLCIGLGEDHGGISESIACNRRKEDEVPRRQIDIS